MLVLLSHLTTDRNLDGFVSDQRHLSGRDSDVREITDMITKNRNASAGDLSDRRGVLTLTGLGIGISAGVLALLAGIFVLIGR